MNKIKLQRRKRTECENWVKNNLLKISCEFFKLTAGTSLQPTVLEIDT